MDSTLVQYLVFIVAALVLIGMVIALNQHLSRRDPLDAASFKDWVELDTRHPQAREELARDHSIDEDENEEVAKLSLRTRQNGHHSSHPDE